MSGDQTRSRSIFSNATCIYCFDGDGIEIKRVGKRRKILHEGFGTRWLAYILDLHFLEQSQSFFRKMRIICDQLLLQSCAVYLREIMFRYSYDQLMFTIYCTD